MVGVALSFAAGIWAVQQFPELPGWPWWVAGCFIIILLSRLKFRTGLCFLLGMLWSIIYAWIGLSDRLPVEMEGKIISIEGRVTGLPQHREKRIRFDLTDIQGPEELPAKLRLNWYYPSHEIKAGQRWSFSVKLKRPHGHLNPGGFDYEYRLLSEGIGATGYVRNKPPPVLVSEKSSLFDISRWRQRISDELDRFEASTRYLGIVKALTIGDYQKLTPAQWDIFRKTGTIHLMVISGMHIGLVAGLVYLVVVKLWARTGILRWSPHHAAALTALSTGGLYAGLAGFSVPTQRALIMLAVVMLGIIWQKNTRSANTLALALLAVMSWEPLAISSPGFWLSFLAVAVIFYIKNGRLRETSRWFMALKIHWVIELALAPLLLFFFQQTSLIGPLANFIAVPAVDLLIVPLLLPAVLLLFIMPAAAQAVLWLVDRLLEGLIWVLSELADLPFAVLGYPQPSMIAVVFFLIGVALLLAPRGLPGRWLGCLMFCPLIFPGFAKLKHGEAKLTLLDAGQGLAAVVQTADHNLIFDTGARFDANSDVGTTVLLPFLRHQGIGKIDTLIISHGDNDHIGGAMSLLAGIETDAVYSSVPEQIDHAAAAFCQAGQRWSWDGVSFTVLSPDENRGLQSKNDNSCVLKVQSAYGSILLTGDIEKKAETWLLENDRANLRSDILIVPHHGSNTSSTFPFLKAVDPDYALIPAGYRNRFGFPHPAVLKRFEQLGITWLDVGQHGAVTVSLTKNGTNLDAQRLNHRRYWHARP